LEEFVLHFQIISAEPFEDLLDYVGDKKNFHVKLPIFINFLNYEQMLLALLWGVAEPGWVHFSNQNNSNICRKYNVKKMRSI